MINHSSVSSAQQMETENENEMRNETMISAARDLNYLKNSRYVFDSWLTFMDREIKVT